VKILIASDKFKGSLSANEVCEALKAGIKKANLSAEIFSKPLADGGDGSLEVLQYYLDLKMITITVNDPLMQPIQASYSMTGDTAYIEMSKASGLILLVAAERNCMHTTSFGTGELITDAIEKGATKIYLFIGGSATNDGGIGIASALGYRFFDADDKMLASIGKNLGQIKRIDNTQLHYNLSTISFQVICDVNNPFFGEHGAAYVYAAQKGASAKEIDLLDKGLENLANCLTRQNYPAIAQVPGAGAAGGVGGGAIAFLGAKLVSGIQTFLDLTQLETILKDCDLIITGEGKIDHQTEQGKVVSGVCQLAKKYQKPVIAVCGIADLPIAESLGIQKVYTVRSRSISTKDAMENAREKLLVIGEELGFTKLAP